MPEVISTQCNDGKLARDTGNTLSVLRNSRQIHHRFLAVGVFSCAGEECWVVETPARYGDNGFEKESVGGVMSGYRRLYLSAPQIPP
jgi:hypothetical protein